MELIVFFPQIKRYASFKLGFNVQKIFGWTYQETLKLPIVVLYIDGKTEIGGRGASNEAPSLALIPSMHCSENIMAFKRNFIRNASINWQALGGNPQKNIRKWLHRDFGDAVEI